MRRLNKIISVMLGAVMTLAVAGGCSGGGNESAGGSERLAESRTLLSPDGNLEMRFGMSEEGTPSYSLDYKGHKVVLDSRLGFLLRGDLNVSEIKVNGTEVTKEDKHPQIDFYKDFEILSVDTCSHDETWHPVWGEEDSIRNHYNEMAVNLKHRPT